MDAAGQRSGPAPKAFNATGATERAGRTWQFSTYFIGVDAEIATAPASDAKLEAAFQRIEPGRRDR